MGIGMVNVDVGEALNGIGGLARDIRAAITGDIDPTKKAELEAKVLEIESKATLGQLKINEQEAKHSSLFVSGWRPFIGWVCGFALLYHYIINRLIEWIVVLKLTEVEPPAFELRDLIVILGGLLGLAGYRTIEKRKGVARN